MQSHCLGKISVSIDFFVGYFSSDFTSPRFAIVMRNALAYSRINGIYTALGIGCGTLFHSTYCILGLAIIISKLLHQVKAKINKIQHHVVKVMGCFLVSLGVRIATTVQHVTG